MRANIAGTPALLSRRAYSIVTLCTSSAGALVAALMYATVDLRSITGLAIVVVLPSVMFAFEYTSQSAVVMDFRRFVFLRIAQASLFLALATTASIVTGRTTPVLGALLVSYVATWPFACKRWFAEPTENRRGFPSWARVSHPGLVLAHGSGRVDLLFVTVAFPSTSAGLYAAAAALPGLAAFLGYGVGVALIPQLRNAQWRAKYRDGVILVLGLSAPLVVLGTLAPEHIVRLLYGAGYLDAAPLLALMAAAAWAWNLSTYQSQVLATRGLAAQQSRAQAVALLLLLTACVGAWLSQNLLIAAGGNLLAYTTAVILQGRALRQRVAP